MRKIDLDIIYEKYVIKYPKIDSHQIFKNVKRQ